MASGSGAVGDLADTSWVDDFSDDDATSGCVAGSIGPPLVLQHSCYFREYDEYL